MGSPPRVRSRPLEGLVTFGVDGITSACAEQTAICPTPSYTTADHLRVCGADVVLFLTLRRLGGSPPRVRSRHRELTQQSPRRGITSACAEQTDGVLMRTSPSEDHLRVCGADIKDKAAKLAARGSPPRVRSRLLVSPVGCSVAGITSACAEQTPCVRTRRASRWDHLRVCGADSGVLHCKVGITGSPPRVRSRPYEHPHQRDEGGITSACAEQTPTHGGTLRHPWDHLRVCGADAMS